MGIKRFSVAGKWILIIHFPGIHGRASVESDAGDLLVLDDKCSHRGGPLHLCYRDPDGISRCPWHDRPVLKRKCHPQASAIYIASRNQVTVISSGADREWPVQVLER